MLTHGGSVALVSYSLAQFRYGGVEDHAGLGARHPKGDGAERRRESRLRTNEPVTLTLLGVSTGLQSPVFEACVLDVSGSGMRARTPGPIPCGALVRVDTKKLLMLGEVCRCERADGAYIVGIQLSHSLAALDDLERLNQALMGGRSWRDLAAEVGPGDRGTGRTRS